MRTQLLLLGTLLLFTPFLSAQDPERAAAAMREDAINQRMRMKPVIVTDGDRQASTPRAVNVDQAQQKTDELNTLIKSVNVDVGNLRKGILSSDLNSKLKRIEKLAKELRRALE